MNSMLIEAQAGPARVSRIEVGRGICDLDRLLGDRRAIIVTDNNLKSHYGDLFGDRPTLVMGCGEGEKSLATLDSLVKGLLELSADRKSFILGFGGGIVCDVAGFLASSYMRGVDFGFVSTSLLSMVDASVGGKNGVNCGGFKNIFGSFNQPQFVCCDIDMLATLPPQELCSGFAEVVKHCLIADEPMLGWLEEHAAEALSLDGEILEALVSHSVETKAAVVNRDEREAGERRKLNFGHTFGHALEACGVFKRHGEAVAVGMMVAARLSQRRGYLAEQDVTRIERVLRALKLPTQVPEVSDAVIAAMSHDKKCEEGMLNAVLLLRIGEAVVEKVMLTDFEEAVRAVL